MGAALFLRFCIEKFSEAILLGRAGGLTIEEVFEKLPRRGTVDLAVSSIAQFSPLLTAEGEAMGFDFLVEEGYFSAEAPVETLPFPTG